MPGVLIAHPSSDAYGADLQVVESVQGLSAHGWQVDLFVPVDGPLVGLAAQLDSTNVHVHDFPVLRKSLLRISTLLLLMVRLPRDVTRLVREIRRMNPDLVYVNTLTIPWWIVAARLARVPVLLHLHEAERDAGRLVGTLLNMPGLLAHAVVANSTHSARVATQSVPRLARRMTVVLNGVPDRGAPPRPNDAEGERVVCVGRLSPRKGTDVALEAVSMLRAEGRDVSLELCGSVFSGYEWFETQLRQRAGRPDLAGAVHFAGHIMPTSPALARASVVVVPSRIEPFGNTAVEAMFAQRPLVASNVDGLAEIVDDGRTGRLVPSDDPRALADAIAQLLDDPSRAAAMAATARDSARRRFSVERYRSDIAAVARELAVGATLTMSGQRG